LLAKCCFLRDTCSKSGTNQCEILRSQKNNEKEMNAKREQKLESTHILKEERRGKKNAIL